MNYVTSFERIGIKKGIQLGIKQGIQLGEGALLIRQLEHKFKTVPDHYRGQIEQAKSNDLLKWGERVLDCQNLEEIFI